MSAIYERSVPPVAGRAQRCWQWQEHGGGKERAPTDAAGAVNSGGGDKY